MTSNSVSWNPVLCKNKAGELLLFYRVGPDPRHTVSFMKKSVDGYHWSAEERLPAGFVGPTKNRPLFIGETLLIPSSVEVGHPEDSEKETACWIEFLKEKEQRG